MFHAFFVLFVHIDISNIALPVFRVRCQCIGQQSPRTALGKESLHMAGKCTSTILAASVVEVCLYEARNNYTTQADADFNPSEKTE